MIIWSRNPIAFPQIITVDADPPHRQSDGATITNVQVVIILTSVLMMAGLLALVHRTKLGIAMRATSQNQQVAGLMGININTRHRAHVRDRRRARRGGRRDGRHLLRHRALPDGLHAGSEGVHRRGAGRHRQPRRRDAGRRAAGPHRGARRGLHRRSHQSVPDRVVVRRDRAALRRRSEPHAVRQQLPGRVRVPRADRGAGLPAFRPAGRARQRRA